MSTWLWPTPGHTTVTSPFGMRNHPKDGEYKMHYGIDIGAPTGTPIVATAAGVVSIATYSSSAGNWIVLHHEGNMSSIYMHLSEIQVVAGHRVSAGQQIGLVGNTGYSEGAHLHFGVMTSHIYDNKYAKDPLNYVDSDNSIIISGSSVSSSSPANRSYTQEDVDQYKNLAVVGRRVSDTTDQPMHAYVSIWVGDELLSKKPQYMQSFEIERYAGVGDTARFTIFDDTWEEIEKIFASNWYNVFIQYGYTGPGGSGATSRKYRMQLTNYSLRFNSTGSFMTVEAIAVGAAGDNLKPVTIETRTKNAGEAIRAICNAAGWEIGYIEPTMGESEEEFTVLNTFPITYIKENILQDSSARSMSGEVLEFYLDAENVAYLVPESFIVEMSTSAEIKTYIHQKGYNSPIIDLEFNINGVFGGTSSYGTASGLATSCFDPYTKEEVSYEVDSQTVTETATGNTMHLSPSQSVPSIDSAGRTGTQAKARLWYSVEKAITDQYEAQMTIVGDPTIQLLDKVRIINVTDEGYLHHTSGIYMVKGIVDNVDGGQMTTSLKLVRNATGAMDAAMSQYGIEVITPKNLVK